MELHELLQKENLVDSVVYRSEVHEFLTKHHEATPQRQASALRALAEIESGIAGLQALGHRYKLVSDENPPALLFPTMVYGWNSETKLVESSDELDSALAEGWFVHPTERPEPAVTETAASRRR